MPQPSTTVTYDCSLNAEVTTAYLVKVIIYNCKLFITLSSACLKFVARQGAHILFEYLALFLTRYKNLASDKRSSLFCHVIVEKKFKTFLTGRALALLR